MIPNRPSEYLLRAHVDHCREVPESVVEPDVGVGVGLERPVHLSMGGFPSPPSEPDVRLSPHPALRGLCCWCVVLWFVAGPWCGDAGSSVAVTVDRDRSRPEHRYASVAYLPVREVAAVQGSPVQPGVSFADPFDDSPPGCSGRGSRMCRRHAVAEVVAPSPQHRVEPA